MLIAVIKSVKIVKIYIMQNIPLNQNEFREKKHNFFDILYSVIVNNRAILLAEFFDLLGDVVNFFDIYGNQEMVIFHPWAIIIMCLSGFSFGMNTLFKKHLDHKAKIH